MTSPWGIPPAAYRLPAASRLGPVRLQVADLDRSLRWYEGTLGLEARERTGGRATLTPRGDSTPLVELRARAGAPPVPRGSRLGLYHFALLLPDRPSLGRFFRHLAALGVRPGAADHLVSEALYLHDPDGLGVEVYADRPRESWRHQDRQVVMATEPLDARGVLASAGGAPWEAMPAGTTLGHVHLQVGDLDAASALYHAALGFDLTVWDYPGALFFSAGGYHHHLGVNSWAGSSATLPAEDDAQLLEWELVLPAAADVDAAASSVERTGHPVRRDDRDAVLTDPWGTALRIRSGSTTS